MNTHIIILYISAALFLFGCGAHSHDHEKENDAEYHDHEKETEAEVHSHADEIVLTPAQAKEANIKTETVEPRTFSETLKVSGQILPSLSDEQTITASANGIVRFTSNLASGSSISQGQTLITISSDGLEQGSAPLKAKAEYEAALSEYNRLRPLADQQIVSQRQLEDARLRLESAKAAYQGMANSLSPQGVKVSAPIGGYVKDINVSQGDYVSTGTPLLTVTQARRLTLRVDLPASACSILSHVSTAHFITSYSDTVYSLNDLGGTLLSKAKSLSDGSPYLPVTFSFDNRGDILPGAYVDVWLIAQPRKDIITVPTSALTESQGLYYVYLQVKGEEHCFTKREVRIGMSDGKRVEITKGLSKGEKVVVQGTMQVKLAGASSAIPEGHSHSH